MRWIILAEQSHTHTHILSLSVVDIWMCYTQIALLFEYIPIYFHHFIVIHCINFHDNILTSILFCLFALVTSTTLSGIFNEI